MIISTAREVVVTELREASESLRLDKEIVATSNNPMTLESTSRPKEEDKSHRPDTSINSSNHM